MPISVAIVGSGPAGFYTAEALLEGGADVAVDFIERLPTPYGLIRGGVAPDHQTTKKISAKFEKVARQPQVRYFGNVAVGREVSLGELLGLYDAVVLAVGAPVDRPLGIPGADKKGVYGSAAFVGWYNAHPDFRGLNPDLGTASVAVIGNGNVSVDVCRVLLRSREERSRTDLPDYAEAAIAAAPIADVHMCGRRGPVEGKFTNVELRELGKLPEAVPVVDARQLPDAVGPLEDDRDRRLKERNLATLKEFAARKPHEKPKRLHFHFYAAPVEVVGGERCEGLKLERTRVEDGRSVGTGETFVIPCGVVVYAIGYRGEPVDGAPFDAKLGVVPCHEGRVAPGLYAVGWIGRGPTGVIASNRPDGEEAAASILADAAGGTKPGRGGLEALLRGRGVRWVRFEEWLKLDALERQRATPPAPRRKFVTVEEMLEALGEPA
jgi:ferredoxin--NADP+ reductase